MEVAHLLQATVATQETLLFMRFHRLDHKTISLTEATTKTNIKQPQIAQCAVPLGSRIAHIRIQPYSITQYVSPNCGFALKNRLMPIPSGWSPRQTTVVILANKITPKILKTVAPMIQTSLPEETHIATVRILNTSQSTIIRAKGKFFMVRSLLAVGCTCLDSFGLQ